MCLKKTLLIEASADNVIVGLWIDEKRNDLRIYPSARTVSELLVPYIEQILKDFGLKPLELEKIVVGSGPGSFTGVRIAVTVAKMLALDTTEIYGVSSLSIGCVNFLDCEGAYVMPLIDARSKSVFAGVYKVEDGKLMLVEKEDVYTISQVEMLTDKYKGNLKVVSLSNNLSLPDGIELEFFDLDKTVFKKLLLLNTMYETTAKTLEPKYLKGV